uniref:ryncolin-2-like n=1 Tax=Styela clava TaxID=7725 RepID=UPI00193A3F87|nr:ryncolin-2-like [Styela clava]
MMFKIALLVLVLMFCCLRHTIANRDTLTPPYTCTTTTRICNSEESNSIREYEMAGPKGEKGETGDPCHCDAAEEQDIEEIKEKMMQLESENQNMKATIKQLQETSQMFPANCSEYRKHPAGYSLNNVPIYPLKIVGDVTPFIVDCTNSSDDDWIVIQRRTNGNVDFYRNWESYASGFGDRDGEFWMGLRTMHKLTSTRNYKLRINLVYKSGLVTTGEYSTFKVAGENSKFHLTVSGHSGKISDMMAPHSGHDFTTYDVDNDSSKSGNCAVDYRGAWWYSNCIYAHLNGEYDVTFDWPFGGHLTFSEMKIRASD